jgi:hypothetical protein
MLQCVWRSLRGEAVKAGFFSLIDRDYKSDESTDVANSCRGSTGDETGHLAIAKRRQLFFVGPTG